MIKSANLALRFFLELCGLAALGYWGFHTGKEPVTKSALGIGTPLLIAIVWAMLGSPGAPVKLSFPLRLLLELVVFGMPAIALYAAGKLGLAVTYGIVVVINRILMFIWQQ
ncbi:YrdB family protein [Brevibacillus sp. SYP-B805]|uniref:YrdB family protein n=1 Tax=Brevibacillus sp. SYP-B805 TaxID=1578199 RepID=UPI0013ED6407|nr:YrdB family protein [Brevibacillus sp. SYP-B805]NGQ96263.1 YrdB family protein [Brevibacillus sp. SYP-B805]